MPSRDTSSPGCDWWWLVLADDIHRALREASTSTAHSRLREAMDSSPHVRATITLVLDAQDRGGASDSEALDLLLDGFAMTGLDLNRAIDRATELSKLTPLPARIVFESPVNLPTGDFRQQTSVDDAERAGVCNCPADHPSQECGPPTRTGNRARFGGGAGRCWSCLYVRKCP